VKIPITIGARMHPGQAEVDRRAAQLNHALLGQHAAEGIDAAGWTVWDPATGSDGESRERRNTTQMWTTTRRPERSMMNCGTLCRRSNSMSFPTKGDVDIRTVGYRAAHHSLCGRRGFRARGVSRPLVVFWCAAPEASRAALARPPSVLQSSPQ
jgi:hypothetical protein